ncbi:MAG: Gfo/Idh/MocA family oxidoreductase [Kiritimatiellae bacterium]|nr:Gfo/Idh/MocA family oxidoreductase [Kiritimatiellia bacterium]
MIFSRRKFVETLSAGTVASSVAWSKTGMAAILAAQSAPVVNNRVRGANDRVNVACVGYSDRFKDALFKCFLRNREHLNFDMVAVADLWKKRLEEKAVPGIEQAIGHKVAAYRSDIELYEKAKDVDAVIISTADFQHAQHATHAVNAGKDAYCEKPMAEDMYSANMLLDAVTAKRDAGFAPGAVLQIGSQRRSGPAYHAAKAFFDSGRFGKLTYVDLCWNVNQNRRWRRSEELVASLKKEDIDWNLWLLDRDPAKYSFDPRKYLEFRLFWPFSSGIPGQWMCHQIDTVAWFTGLQFPLSAMASGGTYAWNDGRMSYDTFTTILEYGPSKLNDKGFQAVFSSRQTNGARGNVEKYYGPNGTIDLIRGRFTSEGGTKKRPDEKLTETVAASATAANTGGDSTESAHMRNWMECVRARKNPNAPVEAGYSHSIALIMSNAASRTGMRATFDPVQRQVIVAGKVFKGYDSTKW